MYPVAKNGRECVCSGKRVLCRDNEQGLTEDVQPDFQIRAAGFSEVPVR